MGPGLALHVYDKTTGNLPRFNTRSPHIQRFAEGVLKTSGNHHKTRRHGALLQRFMAFLNRLPMETSKAIQPDCVATRLTQRFGTGEI
jgi:hypothetical protein